MQQDWNINRAIGWSSMALGVATGLVMGMWSFAGPVPVRVVIVQVKPGPLWKNGEHECPINARAGR